jgi:hypothetical protein
MKNCQEYWEHDIEEPKECTLKKIQNQLLEYIRGPKGNLREQLKIKG